LQGLPVAQHHLSDPFQHLMTGRERLHADVKLAFTDLPLPISPTFRP
jgi:hypothetical protein